MADTPSSLARLALLFNALMQPTRSCDFAVFSPIRITVALAEHSDADDVSDMTPTTSESPASTTSPDVSDVKEHAERTVARTLGEQVSVGSILGFATGYSIRKIGKAVLFVVGTEVAILQYMAYRQWLVMDWRKLARDISPNFSRSKWDKVLDILLYKMPFNVAFSGGLVAGLRLSAVK
eukprot:IDg9309t1